MTGRAREFAYFLDVDGTLADLHDSPSRVTLAAAQRRSLVRLLHRACGAVAIVSGRSIADIDRILRGVQLPAAGLHGTERRDARGRYTRHSFADDGLAHAARGLSASVTRHPGLLLEDKGVSLALHYRRAPALAGYAHRAMRALLRDLGDAFCLQPGKLVVEVKPAGRDKGSAVLDFMRERPFRGRTPVYIGDDVTDEFGFAAVNALGGVSVKVGAGATSAATRLRDVRSVWAWLARGTPLPPLSPVRGARA